MRELYRYILVTLGGPLLVVAILNAALFGELWKLLRINVGSPPPVAEAQEIQDDRIVIPRLGVTAPVILSQHDPTAPWDDIRRDLENGVSLAPSLSRPGQEGTTWITGHSSDYAWRPGEYKTIFALLYLLKPGDEIIVDWEGKRYTYRVTGSQIVRPNEVQAFTHREGKTLTLMTCYPPLTTAKRWLVYAELAS